MSKQKKSCPCGSGKKYRDCCYGKEKSRPASGPTAWSWAWIPAGALCFVAFYVVARGTSVHDYAHYSYWVQNDALNGLSVASFVLAGLLALFPPLKRLAVAHLDKLSRAPWREHLLWVGVAFLGLSVWFNFIRYCEYRAYLLPTDTTVEVQAAYMFLHYGTSEYPLLGMKILAQHFMLFMPFFSPFLLLWNDALVVIFVHNLFVCTIPFMAYALVYSLTASAYAGFLGLLLTVSSPYLYQLLTSNVDVIPIVTFFLGAMMSVYYRRWLLLAVLLVLLIVCKEQVPFIFFGLGVYAVYALRARKPWNWAWGLGLCAAAMLLWRFEMSVIDHYQRLDVEQAFIGVNKWGMFAHLAPKDTPPAKIASEILGHPLLLVRFFLSSIYVYYPLLRVLFSMGFLCLLAPMEMIPFAAAFLPHLMANPGAPAKFLAYNPVTYFDFALHESIFIMGPLIWATAYGIRNAYRTLSPRGLEGWLLVWSLVFAGFGFKYAHRTLNPNWRANWFDAAPRVMARIPEHARLWGDEYILAPVSTRRWLKNIMWGPESPDGYKSLFKPDYALFDKAFVVYAKPPYRDRMLTFFGQNHYRKIEDDNNLLLLRSPNPAARPEEVPEWIELPQADPKIAQAYGEYLLHAPVERP